jgi:hypothetical protein
MDHKIWIPADRVQLPLEDAPVVREIIAADGSTVATGLDFGPDGNQSAYFELEIPDQFSGMGWAQVYWTAQAGSVEWLVEHPGGRSSIADALIDPNAMHITAKFDLPLDGKHLTVVVRRARATEQSGAAATFLGLMIGQTRP